MRIGMTGATGFIGRYIVSHLVEQGHQCRCWFRPQSNRSGLDEWTESVEWIPGELGDDEACRSLVAGCDAVVHGALHRPGRLFRGGEGNLVQFAEKNVLGSLQLIQAAREADVPRFIYISSCAVHEKILDDRPLDETHPLWPTSHYGAHKAAVEKFVHSYGLGEGYPICALRPTGVYGRATPVERSKWFSLIRSVVRGEPVECRRGGKEVHAADVARAVGLLLTADGIAGEAYNCYDLYVSEFDVATIAREITGSDSEIQGSQKRPQHQIVTEKLRRLGMEFGGRPQLEETIRQIIDAVQ